MKLDINNYPGSKGGWGVKEWIINHVPKFNLAIDAFAGSGTIGFDLMDKQDPPYMFDTRKSQKPIYLHECSIEDHISFFKVVKLLMENDAFSKK